MQNRILEEMRLCIISFVTPASENIRGTSALPYHLIKGMRTGTVLNVNVNDNGNDKGNLFEIYTFNNNGLSDEKIAEVEKELGATIKKIPLPSWYRWMFKLHLLFLRMFLKYPFMNYIKLPKLLVEEIKAQKPDLIWVMGEELSRIVKQFPKHRRVQIGPDTESLYYYRMMGQRFVMNNPIDYWKCALMYRKYARMEREFCTDENFTYYAVGEEDVRHLQQINPKVKAKFLRHPHYEVRQHFVNENVNVNDNHNDSLNVDVNVLTPKGMSEQSSLHVRKFHQPKIKVLIAGRYDLYMKQEADLLVEQICNVNVNDNVNLTAAQYENDGGKIVNVPVPVNVLKEHYVFTFLGKGWEKHVETMRQAGYEVEHITFAPDYIEEIVKHDIQITPIAIGTGTKGKVLDALANGLLVIGTPYAMENIAVENGESCIEYRDPQEVIKILLDIVKDVNVNGNVNENEDVNVNENDNENETFRYENSNRRKYEKIAAEGQRQVLKHHDRKLIAQQLFGL